MDEKSELILLVEDSVDDVMLIRRAFIKADLQCRIQVAPDGDEALVYLAGIEANGQGKNPAPALVLLDLKLPRRSGLEVLAWLKRQPRLKRTPVIVLTSSRERSDIEQAYDLGANSYLVKPVKFDELVAMVRLMGQYWMELNRFVGGGNNDE